MVLKMQGAVPLDTIQYRSIETMVRELASADGLPMPKLYFVDTPIPNAFATGRSHSHSVVAVTRGITELLDDDELRGVLAHELGHVKNRDMLISTIAATLAGAVSFLADIAMWGGALFGSNDDEGRNIFGSIAMMLLAPFTAMLIQMAVSRTREFGADAHGAALIGSGEPLARALTKLESFKPDMANYQPSPAEQTTAHLMFTNMFNLEGFSSLFSTHPRTADRVKRLRRLN